MVVVATLAAAYYFIVRPVLDTTEKVSSGINGNIQRSLDEANRAFDQANIQVSPETMNEINTDITSVPASKQPRLAKCIQRKPGNLRHIERCARRLSR